MSSKNEQLKPKKALNKAYLKVKPIRADIEKFKANLIGLLDGSNDTESEEFHKNLVSDFLKKTYYDPNHSINTKGRNDLVIHNGEKSDSTVGVIIEAKKPTNTAEMPKGKDLNCKAMQELVLYYLRERINLKNLEVKHLVVTNIYEWYIFDAQEFDRLFAQDKKLLKQFHDFEAGTLADTKTDFFYKEIAAPALGAGGLSYTYFDFRTYEKVLRNTDKTDDRKLIALYKLISPEHLLKLPFANDSNSLDKKFYSELLHIIGLAEVKDGGKKLIQRADAKSRNQGSLLENAILQLDVRDKLSRVNNLSSYGTTTEDKLFGVGLELSITWINRILFLKLLEGQLVAYHKGDQAFRFMNYANIAEFDELDALFFQVLAKKQGDRAANITEKFGHVPYLNSSLFEPQDIEHNGLFISELQDNKTLPILSSTVLKDENGKKLKGELNTLGYLFAFLDAYDFASEGTEDIQEDNKQLINASVLGLIFEKINGYKDGSFFTPGFITMYMCKETIRRAVLQKFEDSKGWKCKDLDALYEKIEDKKEANELINNLKICDPAVGSGHFLVSALNEMIAIKSELRILQDRTGKTLRDYEVSVVNDELVVTNDDGEPFEYHVGNAEQQRVQETLFHEKQTIIENCLFGVDINPNSVKICQLRLWIELLKNSYYKSSTELETLPNIDINIKCGNSLISRFGLDADIRKALKKSKYSIDAYRVAVSTYRNAADKEEKRAMQQLIDTIKGDFETNIDTPFKAKIAKARGEADLILTDINTKKQWGDKITKDVKTKLSKALAKLEKLELQRDEIQNNKIYENAFEWRFEFPEVLDDDGTYVGFDVVIGNPPYGVKLETEEKNYYKELFDNVHIRTPDTFNYFISSSLQLLKNQGYQCFIVPNNLLFQNEYEKTRKLLTQNYFCEIAFNLGDNIFEDANVPTCVVIVKKENRDAYDITYGDYRNWSGNSDLLFHPDNLNKINITDLMLIPGLTFGVDNRSGIILDKMREKSLTIDQIATFVSSGVSTGGDKIFRISKDFVNENKLETDILKPVLSGGDIKEYSINYRDNYLIYSTKQSNTEQQENIFNYLTSFKDKLSQKRETKKGMIPWWCLHWPRNKELFEENKIILRQTSDSIRATFDDSSFYVLNSILILKLKDSSLMNYSFILGILNSKLNNFIYRLLTQEEGRVFAEVKPKNVRKLLIPNLEIDDKLKIASKVTQILALKKEDPVADAEVSALEAEIDAMVYELYGLSEEEIAIVENA